MDLTDSHKLSSEMTVDQVVAGSNPVRHPPYMGDFERNLSFFSKVGNSIKNIVRHLVEIQNKNPGRYLSTHRPYRNHPISTVT